MAIKHKEPLEKDEPLEVGTRVRGQISYEEKATYGPIDRIIRNPGCYKYYVVKGFWFLEKEIRKC